MRRQSSVEAILQLRSLLAAQIAVSIVRRCCVVVDAADAAVALLRMHRRLTSRMIYARRRALLPSICRRIMRDSCH